MLCRLLEVFVNSVPLKFVEFSIKVGLETSVFIDSGYYEDSGRMGKKEEDKGRMGIEEGGRIMEEWDKNEEEMEYTGKRGNTVMEEEDNDLA